MRSNQDGPWKLMQLCLSKRTGSPESVGSQPRSLDQLRSTMAVIFSILM